MNRTIAALGTTIFETMSALARETGAINLVHPPMLRKGAC